MIQAPDFREKQIFFFDATEIASCEVKLRNENILLIEDGKTKDKIPIHRLLAVFVIGDMTITTKLIQKMMRAGVSVFFLKRNLETYASVESYAEGNYLLRQQQYALEDEKSLAIAKGIVQNKLRSQLTLLRGDSIATIAGKKRMDYKKKMLAKIAMTENLASLRGVEGVISKDFFAVYFAQVDWYKRVPRGKVDPNNILLDIGYSFLFHFIDSLLRVYGFDTYKGIYHQLYFQRKSLACDMMEPFRCVIDRALVKAHRLGQYDKKDFTYRQGQYYLSYKHNGKYAKIFLSEILRYKVDMYNYIRDHYYLILNDEGKISPFIIR